MNSPSLPVSTTAAIGLRLRAERHRLAMTQAELGAAGGVTKTTQHNYEAGGRSPDADYLSKLAALGVDVHFVITGVHSGPASQYDDGPLPVPELQPVRGTSGQVAAEEQPTYAASLGCVTRHWLAQRKLELRHLGALVVRGTAMQGDFPDGTLLIINTADAEPRGGAAFAIQQGQDLTVRYCQQMPGGLLRVSSANSAFPPFDVDPARASDFKVIGRVVASMQDW